MNPRGRGRTERYASSDRRAGVYIRCPDCNYIQTQSARFFTDIDFMAYFSQRHDVEQLFKRLGYVEDLRIKTVPGLRRSIFFHRDHPWHSDVFYDVLDFSHEIDLKGGWSWTTRPSRSSTSCSRSCRSPKSTIRT